MSTVRVSFVSVVPLILLFGCGRSQRERTQDAAVDSPANEVEEDAVSDDVRGQKKCDGGATFGNKSSPWRNPVVQCHWTDKTPEGDDIYVTPSPLVIDLDRDGKAEIVFVSTTFTPVPNFFLNAIRGDDCKLVWKVPTDIQGENEIAAADLDADGRPEIVGFDAKTDRVIVHDSAGALLARGDPVPALRDIYAASGVAIADLDGKAPAEIVVAGAAFRYESGPPARVATLWANTAPAPVLTALLSVVADVDRDGLPEVITGNRIYDGVTGADKTPAPLAERPAGLVAIADLDRSTPAPEIVLVSNSMVPSSVAVLDALTGAAVFGPYELETEVPLSNQGGPPTIADFDGDYENEIGIAARDHYQVYDPECASDPPPPGCEAPGLRWSTPIQDSSSITSSSVFDFNADCAEEVVYRDECWLRIMDGGTGKVLAVYGISSGTALDEPVIADVDGDGHAEIVVSSMPTSNPCVGKPEPSTGTPWPGSSFGIFVLEDERERWVGTRAIWNQNSYHVTNVNDDGTVPIPEPRSWEGPNSYRQNVRR